MRKNSAVTEKLAFEHHEMSTALQILINMRYLLFFFFKFLGVELLTAYSVMHEVQFFSSFYVINDRII